MMLPGNLFVIAAPSGTGKTSLVSHLVSALPNLTVSISHTTRPARPNEKNGLNYHFVDHATFQAMIDRGDFLEYATIFDHLYGTSKQWVQDTLAQGVDVILEIDWQGHQQIKHLFPDSIGIFILPPAKKELLDRLTTRNQDSVQVIEERLADTDLTVSHYTAFDYLIVNGQFNQAVDDLSSILKASRLAIKRQAVNYADLLAEFL